jgi:thioesterase domain-containing protein
LLAELSRGPEPAAGTDRIADVVLLRRGRDPAAAPLVLAHPIGGSLFCYAALCQHVPDGRAIWGVAAGPELTRRRDLTVERLAERYVAALGRSGVRQVAALAGWSFGGLLSYEMARQWGSPGITPPVVLIDSVPWPAGLPPWEQPTMLRTFAEYLAGLAGVIFDDPDPDTRDPGPWQLPVHDALITAVAALRARGVDPGFSDDELLARFWIYANNATAMSRYRPVPLGGPAILLQASESAADRAAWGDTTGVTLTVVPVPGNHFTLLRLPAVRQVAQVLHAAANHSRPDC